MSRLHPHTVYHILALPSCSYLIINKPLHYLSPHRLSIRLDPCLVPRSEVPSKQKKYRPCRRSRETKEVHSSESSKNGKKKKKRNPSSFQHHLYPFPCPSNRTDNACRTTAFGSTTFSLCIILPFHHPFSCAYFHHLPPFLSIQPHKQSTHIIMFIQKPQ